MLFDMLEYSRMLEKNCLSIIYSGPLWAGGIEGMAVILKRRLAYDELPLPASQAVFSIFVEQVNNMLMYSKEKERFEGRAGEAVETSKGTIVMGKTGKTYFMQSGNVMDDKNIDNIREKIDYLNRLDKKELRMCYKDTIKKENRNPESRGAGLGLIEIARRASSKIEYEFTPLEEGKSYFTMYVEIN